MIEHQADLTPFNTLALTARAEQLARPASVEALATLLAQRPRSQPLTVLGEGSNVVLTDDLPGLTVVPAMAEMTRVDEDAEFVWVRAGAGVHWDTLVDWTVEQGWQGLENLSLIPGAAGAAPFQNIGAYGVELADVLEHLTAVDVNDGQAYTFDVGDCEFAYRDSRFKSVDRGRFIITDITLRLRKAGRCNISYGPLQACFANHDAASITPAAVRAEVIALRQSKLPDPARLANAGSFFKNPVVSEADYLRLKHDYPKLVAFPLKEGVKLAAGWLIEQAGWKGKSLGPVGMHKQQALVLVNYGGASSDDVLALAQAVKRSVWERFQVPLEQEPVILP